MLAKKKDCFDSFTQDTPGAEMRNLQFFPLLLLFSISCVPITTTITRTNDTVYASKPVGCNIQILSQAPANGKFVEIAILNTLAVEASYGKDLNAMLPSIKETACRLGADAVLIRNVESGSQYTDMSGKVYSVAIKYTE